MKEQILAVQRMQDYIKEHICEDITMTALSTVALYSPWYSYRIFRLYTGLSPADYIRRMRLSESAVKLKNEHCRVTDIAYEMGFGSIDGFTRAFSREFSCKPGEYVKNPIPITLFIPYGVVFNEIRKEPLNMEKTQNIFIQVVVKTARKVIIKRGICAEDYFPYCEEVGCDVWGLLTSMDSLCGEPVCLWLSDKYILPNTSKYVQGVEVSPDYTGAVPTGFDVIDLPEAEYIMFQGEPFLEEDYCTAIEAVQSAMAKYEPSVIGYAWDDTNPRIQLEPRGERGYIELRAVKKIS